MASLALDEERNGLMLTDKDRERLGDHLCSILDSEDSSRELRNEILARYFAGQPVDTIKYDVCLHQQNSKKEE